MILGREFKQQLGSLALEAQQAPSQPVAALDTVDFLSDIPRRLIKAAREGKPGLDVYECCAEELAFLNAGLGENYSYPSVNWVYADAEGEIPRALQETRFGKVIAYCQHHELEPVVYAEGLLTQLVRVGIRVGWLED